MKIGLYFGSFNPVHAGHLIIANHILNHSLLDRIWFVVSPQNPFKPSSGLLNEYNRLYLLKVATEDDARIKVSDMEFALPKPSYTSVTLAHMQEKYPDHEFSVVMGADSFQNIAKWHNAEYILEHFPILVYPRPGFEVVNQMKARVSLVDAPLLEISATEVRQLIKSGKSIRYIVPDIVREEIEKGGYYK
jgi:nicotinate-nucleotide adenylyltransferase